MNKHKYKIRFYLALGAFAVSVALSAGYMGYGAYKSHQLERECASEYNVYECVYGGAWMPTDYLPIN